MKGGNELKYSLSETWKDYLYTMNQEYNVGFPLSCENPIEHMKSVLIISLKALSSKFIKMKRILLFNIIHSNIHFICEISNMNYNLSNVSITTLMKKLYWKLGVRRLVLLVLYIVKDNK